MKRNNLTLSYLNSIYPELKDKAIKRLSDRKIELTEEIVNLTIKYYLKEIVIQNKKDINEFV